MTSVGIRELRDGLSRHLADVRAGQTITVTDHGTPVARITPIDHMSALERLVADGVVELPAQSKHPAGDPVVADARLAEQVIADRR